MSGQLARVVSLPGALLLGLGSIVGTGIFVAIGLAAAHAGMYVLVAIPIAGVLAVCNGMSSAQLAANHPVSGGTYEYGHRYLTPALGFAAGWLFLCAKSASAATAALGLASYAMVGLGADAESWLVRALAIAVVCAVTALVAGGIRRSNRSNAVIVVTTLAALAVFVVIGALDVAATTGLDAVWALGRAPGWRELAAATAIVFVAFTGYGRIATLGEEVHDPRRTIPRAIVIVLVATIALYIAVTAVALGLVGPDALAAAAAIGEAPLEVAAADLPRWVRIALVVGATSAMAGVVLNLVLGLSRVVLAMARRSELPGPLASIDAVSSSPRRAVVAVGCVIGVMAAIGSIRAAWSFSAVTVLVYYAITNVAALKLPPGQRRHPRIIAVLGLLGCVALAAWVDAWAWVAAAATMAGGFVLRWAVGRSTTTSAPG